MIDAPSLVSTATERYQPNTCARTVVPLTRHRTTDAPVLRFIIVRDELEELLLAVDTDKR